MQHQARPRKGKFQNLEVEGIGSKASKSESFVEQNGSFFPEHLEPLNKGFAPNIILEKGNENSEKIRNDDTYKANEFFSSSKVLALLPG